MVEVGSSERWKQDWSNLPHDLLSRIVYGLGLEELHSLRRVCKDWRQLSSKAFLEKIESFGCHNWFLLYDGVSSKCSLIRDQYKISITIPELEGATCLASHEGWLLVFRSGSLFFFCPFSGAKIDLPSCPFTELSGHAAAFSAPPTCQDCIVVVITRCSDDELELHLLSRGHATWAKYNFSCGRQSLGKITTAVFRERWFQFSGNNFQGLVTFCAATKTWKCYRYKTLESDSLKHSKQLRGNFRSNSFLDRLRLHENTDSISTCGTLYYRDYGIVMGESVEATAIGSESRHLKGLRIMPIFHIPSMDQKW